MTIFEYVLVLITVVLSLGMAHLLTAVAGLIKAGPSVRWCLTYALWLAIALFMYFDVWTSLWTLRETTTFSLLAVLTCFLTIAAVFFTTVLITPEHLRHERVDLWAFHMGNRRRYVGAFMAYLLLGALMNVAVLPAEQFAIVNLVVMLPALAVAGAAYAFDNRWVQRLAPMAEIAMVAVYLSLFFGVMET